MTENICKNCKFYPKEGENYPLVCGGCCEFYPNLFEEK